LVLFILFIAILNLGLGYGLALYLHGWRLLPNDWNIPLLLKSFSLGKDSEETAEKSLAAIDGANRDVAPAIGSTPFAASHATSTPGSKPTALATAAGAVDDELTAASGRF
jgi:hypothetical protein